MAEDALIDWLRSAPDAVKEVFGSSIHVINFLHDQRNRCFQTPRANDGSISEECTRAFEREFLVFDAFIKAAGDWR